MPITNKEIENAVREELSAWDSHDMKAVERIIANAIGLGFRTIAWRDHKKDGKEGYQILNRWISAHDYFHVELDELNTFAEGNIGFAWGFYIEDFKIKDKPPERVRVRFSFVFKKEDDICKEMLYHRDIQPFDESGRYRKDLQ